MVERFRIWAHDCDPEITPDERGGWVTHFDYAALESNVAALRAENDQLRRELDAIRNETLEAAAERAKSFSSKEHIAFDIREEIFPEQSDVQTAIAAAIRNLKE